MIVGVDAWGLSGPARYTGMGQYAETLITGIARLGGDVSLIAYGAVDERRPEWLPDAVGWRSANRGVHPKLAAISSRLWELPRQAAGDRLDLFHSPAVHVRPSLPPVPRLRCPVIATVHDVIPLTYYGRDLPARLRAFYRWNLRRAVSADHVVTVSEDSRRQIGSLTHTRADRIDVIPNAVDFEPNPDRDAIERLGVAPPFILYAGSYEPRKNLAGALRSFKLLVDRGLPHRLVALVERDSGHAPAARQLLEELGLNSRVDLVHSLEKSDLRALYTFADAVFFPSFAEGFGLPLVQAETCGVPVVASDLAVLHEVGGGEAEYVDPTDPDEMAQALVRAVGRKRTEAHRAAAFGVGDFVRSHLETYARLAGRGRSAQLNIA